MAKAGGAKNPAPERTAYGAGIYPIGHYYSPLPNIDEVLRDFPRLYPAVPSRELPGIALNDAEQLATLARISPFMVDAPFGDQKQPGLRYYYQNSFFSYTDALFLYGMMRHLQPRRIIEVGSGFSSAVMLDTNERFLDNRTELMFVEPYPDALKRAVNPTDRIELRQQRLQDVDIALFDTLEANDILFIDSTHVAKIGSDVNYYLFDVFPRLKPGVMIHIHDVYYPFEYPQFCILKGMFWNECYMLRAFLTHSTAYEIVLFSHYLALFHLAALQALHPLCVKNIGGNLWLRKQRA
jgi:predicted O-methyltransferase YrrM